MCKSGTHLDAAVKVHQQMWGCHKKEKYLISPFLINSSEQLLIALKQITQSYANTVRQRLPIVGQIGDILLREPSVKLKN